MKILIIKNNTSESSDLADQISKLGHNIDIAVNGEDGYTKYLENNPDLIISDINLKDIDGIKLAQRIREFDESIVIVLHSDKSEPEYISTSVLLDVKFIHQPLDEQYIINIIESAKLVLDNRSKKNIDSKLLMEYKKVVDASSIVSKTNTKGIITFVNDEFCKISGYSQDELLGKNHNIVRHPNMPSEAFADLWKTIKAKKIWKGVVENLKKDGGSYFVKATIVPVLDESGNVVEFIGLREDITDLMEKEREIERLNAQNLKTVADKAFSIKTLELLKAIPIPLVSIDKHDNILQYNDEFHNLFSIDTANEFLTNLADNKANINDVISFEKDEDEEEMLDWKDEMIAFGENFEVSFKHENSGRKFSLRMKEDEENNFIVAFTEENV